MNNEMERNRRGPILDTIATLRKTTRNLSTPGPQADVWMRNHADTKRVS